MIISSSFHPLFKQGYLGDPGQPGPVHFQDGHDARGKNMYGEMFLTSLEFISEIISLIVEIFFMLLSAHFLV